MTAYLDANVVVYLIEQPPRLGAMALGVVNGYYRQGHSLAVSHLVRLECVVAPLSKGNQRLVQMYDALLASDGVQVLDCPPDAFDRAASIRAHLGIPTIDALHLAIAIVGGCDRFITNDAKLRRVADIEVELLEP